VEKHKLNEKKWGKGPAKERKGKPIASGVPEE